MNDSKKEARIAYLEKTLAELDSLSDEDFFKIVENKYGTQIATMTKTFGFSDYARQMLAKMVQSELQELKA